MNTLPINTGNTPGIVEYVNLRESFLLKKLDFNGILLERD